MKHVKLFEDFDPFQFMEDPESEFRKQEESSEIQEGDYVDTYRGKGRVISIDGEFTKVQMMDLSKAVVKVPTDMLKKIKQADVLPTSDRTMEELRTILAAAKNYNNILEDDSQISDVSPIVNFLEETLVDIGSLYGEDKSIARTEEYDELVSELARLSYFAYENAPELKGKLDKIVHSFSKFVGENRLADPRGEDYSDVRSWIHSLEPTEMAYLLTFLANKGIVPVFDKYISEGTFEISMGYLDNPDISISAAGTYNIDVEEARFKGDYWQPPDPDNWRLTSIDVDQFQLFIDGDSVLIQDNECINLDVIYTLVQEVVKGSIQFDDDDSDSYSNSRATQHIPDCVKRKIVMSRLFLT